MNSSNIHKLWKETQYDFLYMDIDQMEAAADHCLIYCLRRCMENKLVMSREKGRYGWWNGTCSNEKLKALLIDHIDKGDMLDVVNLAGMIWFREQAVIESKC